MAGEAQDTREGLSAKKEGVINLTSHQEALIKAGAEMTINRRTRRVEIKPQPEHISWAKGYEAVGVTRAVPIPPEYLEKTLDAIQRAISSIESTDNSGGEGLEYDQEYLKLHELKGYFTALSEKHS